MWGQRWRPHVRSHLHSAQPRPAYAPRSLPGQPARTLVGTLPRWEPM